MRTTIAFATVLAVAVPAGSALACGTCGPVASTKESIVLVSMIATPFLVGLGCVLIVRSLVRKLGGPDA